MLYGSPLKARHGVFKVWASSDARLQTLTLFITQHAKYIKTVNKLRSRPSSRQPVWFFGIGEFQTVIVA